MRSGLVRNALIKLFSLTFCPGNGEHQLAGGGLFSETERNEQLPVFYEALKKFIWKT
jgi:hypothetical protein